MCLMLLFALYKTHGSATVDVFLHDFSFGHYGDTVGTEKSFIHYNNKPEKW